MDRHSTEQYIRAIRTLEQALRRAIREQAPSTRISYIAAKITDMKKRIANKYGVN